MIEVAVAAATFMSVVSIGGGALVVQRGRRDAREARQRVVEDLTEEPEDDRSQLRLVRAMHRIGEFVSSGKFSLSLTQSLARAGYHARNAPAVYIGSKIALLLLAAAVSTALMFGTELSMPVRLSVTMLVAATCSMVPNLVVSARRRARERATQRFLPDAVDLLEVCVSSGMGLDQAWNSVAEEIRRVSTILSDEMELTSLEMRLGVPRHVAMRNMCDRTGADEISSLVALMVQSERFGASIITALQTFAKSMREASSMRAEESAEKMAVKMLAPMVLFIFPTLLIVMVGPALMRIVDVMT